MTSAVQAIPFTPPRRTTSAHTRRTHLTPSPAPHVTPSKKSVAVLRSSSSCPHTPPIQLAGGGGGFMPHRSLSKLSSPALLRTPISSPARSNTTARGGASTLNRREFYEDVDRFIPSRRALPMDLCRRAILSDPKKRIRSASTTNEPHSSPGPRPPTEPHDPTAPASLSSTAATALGETILHKEFKRRMLSALCNVPLDRLDEEGEPTAVMSFRSRAAAAGSTAKKENCPRLADPFALDSLRAMKFGTLYGSTDLDQFSSEHWSVASKVVRKVPCAPTRILDAPDIVDDYYLNLISWSQDNILAVALSRSVYLWHASSGDIQHLVTVDQGNDYITSVKWCSLAGQTRYIAVGTNKNVVHLFDGHTCRAIRTLEGHRSRVSALAWSPRNCLSSGSRDSTIVNHDIRSPQHLVGTYRAHTQEVCGLQWNDDGSCLASGGNENYLCLWDAAMSSSSSSARSLPGANPTSTRDYTPRLLLKEHKAAVKAIDWCPFHRSLLASGGGTADRTIKFWNSSSGAVLNSIDTGSQVCSILWSKHQRELCSSHGYSENQLILWKYPTMTKIKELTGHTSRVLSMEMSPDGTCVVSASADETLRFWNIFSEVGSLGGSSVSSSLGGRPFGSSWSSATSLAGSTLR